MMRRLLREPAAVETWSRTRSDIRAAAERVFQRPMEIAERAYQALEVVTRRGRAPTPAHVWRAIAQVTPAIASLYDAVGSHFYQHRTPFPRRLRQVPVETALRSSDWERTLRSAFFIEQVGNVGRRFSLVDAGRHTSDAGFIGPDDLALAILQSGRIPEGDRQRHPNPVLRNMAKHAGIKDRQRWSPRLEAFSQRVHTALRSILDIDPSIRTQHFVLYHDGGAFRTAPFGATGGYSCRNCHWRMAAFGSQEEMLSSQPRALVQPEVHWRFPIRFGVVYTLKWKWATRPGGVSSTNPAPTSQEC